MSEQFNILKDFIQNWMRMSHIYQPVMLSRLLESNGRSTTEEIARAILSHDPSQVEYYQQITTGMVGRVLRKHSLVTKESRKPNWELVGVDQLSEAEVSELIKLCQDKLDNFLDARGQAIWNHRRRGRRPVSGTIRYEVLKRAKYRCELCGISAKEKALEVDHITPKSLGGDDEISNYQALCYTCNAQKLNRDDTDFRGIDEGYEYREPGCLFCEAHREREVLAENTLAYAIDDGYPVTIGHSLVIPKRHVATYFELTQAEINACNQLLNALRENKEKDDPSITGWNIGINAGEDAGQTIFHCHIHLVPRRKGDVDNPRGGVRHMIPGKGSY
ncbi:MAG: HIT domain-containing protein [Candidatus Sedimenticola sp. (ex Thyasira tokunagai)]